MEIFRKFEQNRNFSKILPKIEIFRKFDQNRNFSKIWLESKFFEILEYFD